MSIADRMSGMAMGGEQAHEAKPMGHEGGDPVHEHLKTLHAKMGGKHTHVQHHEDGTHTSHHISEDGEASGPHDAENMDDLKDNMDRFLSEEKDEGSDEGRGRQKEHDGLM